MPRRKKLPQVDYNGLGKRSDNLVVQKTNPLLSLSETGLTLAEFKILDAYLGRIDSHAPDKRLVSFEKGEIERLLDVVKINATDLEKRIDNLFQVVTIRDAGKKDGFIKIALFERAECSRNEDGTWQIILGASLSAMEYIFNPERLGYLRYNLRNVIKLTSRYSYILFLYLEQNRHMHLTWEVELDELKALLRCEADTYKEFKYFNKLVLKKCFDELNAKTDCKFTYEPVKKGRLVKCVRFSLESLVKTDDVPGQLTIEDFSNMQREDDRDNICAGFSSSEFDGFTTDQLKLLKDLAWDCKHDENIERHYGVLQDYALACQYATADYLRQSILMAKSQGAKNLYLYVKKMVENDRQR